MVDRNIWESNNDLSTNSAQAGLIGNNKGTRMSIAISSVRVPATRQSEASEGPGPDRAKDGDGDDAGAKVASTSAPAPAGTGKVVDKTV